NLSPMAMARLRWFGEVDSNFRKSAVHRPLHFRAAFPISDSMRSTSAGRLSPSGLFTPRSAVRLHPARAAIGWLVAIHPWRRDSLSGCRLTIVAFLFPPECDLFETFRLTTQLSDGGQEACRWRSRFRIGIPCSARLGRKWGLLMKNKFPLVGA